MRNAEFRILEDKGIVICKLWDSEYAALDTINSCIKVDIDNEDRYLVNGIYVGTAQCSPDREFSAEEGKRISYRRARAKRDKAVYSAVKRYLTDMKQGIKELEGELSRY